MFLWIIWFGESQNVPLLTFISNSGRGLNNVIIVVDDLQLSTTRGWESTSQPSSGLGYSHVCSHAKMLTVDRIGMHGRSMDA